MQKSSIRKRFKFFEYVDANGVLHEKFYLIPVGFIFIFSGMITFFHRRIKKIITNRK